ncbi:MAG: GNAT family N-acetyltransferase [Lachnospiraceae bacterium]|nr:GNAT family N-acetyltransferase [Lachnospiraceae bacterium]
MKKEKNVKTEVLEDKDIYMSNEEISAMSEEELIGWINALNEEAQRMIETGDIEYPELSLADIEAAYGDPDYRGYIEAAQSIDPVAQMFDDKEELEELRRLYDATRKENAGKALDDDIYNKLYAVLYSNIRRVNPFWAVGMERLDLWRGLQEEYRTVYTLTKETAEPFKKLVPPEEYALIGKNGCYALGSVSKDKGSEKAAGVLIFTVNAADGSGGEPVACINWLYVAEEYRGHHAGDHLMAAMYDTLNRSGIKAVTCSVPAAEMMPMFVCDFLTCWWLYFNLEPMAEMHTSLSELSALPAFSKKLPLKSGESIHSLKELKLKKFAAEAERIAYVKGEKRFSIEESDSLEEDLSAVIMNGDTAEAFLLVDITPSGVISLRLMRGSAKAGMLYLKLLQYALDKALEKYDDETVVYIEPKSKAAENLLNSLFKGRGIPLYLVGVNISAEDEITPEIFAQFRIMHDEEAAAK